MGENFEYTVGLEDEVNLLWRRQGEK